MFCLHFVCITQTLDLKALTAVIDALEPDKDRCKETDYQKEWLTRIRAAKPVIESILYTVDAGNSDLFGELSVSILHDLRLVLMY